MRWLVTLILCLWVIQDCPGGSASSGKIIKVLPQFLDLKGRHALSPSLYERDAYQAYLRDNPEKRSGLSYRVQWKGRSASATLKLRVELRASHLKSNQPLVLEQEAKGKGFWGHWTAITLTGPKYKEIGEVIAWRVTLWDGDKQVSEQKSFLW